VSKARTLAGMTAFPRCPRAAVRVILREIMVGALNGAAFGVIAGAVASIWPRIGLT